MLHVNTTVTNCNKLPPLSVETVVYECQPKNTATSATLLPHPASQASLQMLQLLSSATNCNKPGSLQLPSRKPFVDSINNLYDRANPKGQGFTLNRSKGLTSFS
jgi:hypothetical protein